MVQKILGKSDSISKKTKEKKKKEKKREKDVWLSGRLHIEGRSNGGPRLQGKHKDENEQNKTNATPGKDVMTSADQTPPGR